MRRGEDLSDDVVDKWYKRCSASYFTNTPSLAYVDILARKTIAGDKDAAKELTVVMGGLAEAISAKYASAGHYRGLERNDMRQEAIVAMIASLKKWQPTKASFRTYAYGSARYALLNALNRSLIAKMPKNSRKDIEGSSSYIRASALQALEAPMTLTPSSDDDADLAEVLGEVEQDFEETSTLLAIQQIYKRASLTEAERRALEARFGVNEEAGFGAPRTERARVQDLAEELGISEKAAHQLAAVALSKVSMDN